MNRNEKTGLKDNEPGAIPDRDFQRLGFTADLVLGDFALQILHELLGGFQDLESVPGRVRKCKEGQSALARSIGSVDLATVRSSPK